MAENFVQKSVIPGYQLHQRIGEGGMGEVFLATQLSLNRLVVVKYLKPKSASEVASLTLRFDREASLMGEVSHPHIVTVFDRGTVEGQPYLVMEYIDGENLRQRLQPGTPMPVAEARSILQAVSQALGHLHERGILHRDLKPENVLLDRQGHVKVSDFGLAVSTTDIGSVTQSGQSVGTIDYMAPEQRHRLGIDERADQFSLAVIAYELLTGDKPLGIFKRPSEKNPLLTQEVDAAILRALQRDPDDRYRTIAEFAESLDRALFEIQRLPGRRLRALIASAVLVGIVIGSVWLWPRLRANAPVRGASQSGRDEVVSSVSQIKTLPQSVDRKKELAQLKNEISHLGPSDFTFVWTAKLRARLTACLPEQSDADVALETVALMARLPWPADALQRERIPSHAFKMLPESASQPARDALVAVLTITHSSWGNWINSVVFSPDGETLASGSNDGMVLLWDIPTLRCRHVLKGHTKRVTCVVFSPDGGRLASASWDGAIRLWDASTGEHIRTLIGHRGRVWSVDFSADGTTLASAGADGTAKLWDVKSGQVRHSLQGHTGCVYSAAFNPDGKTLASGGEDGTIRLWKVATGAKLQILEGHAGCVRSVAFSPDRATLASGSEDGTVKLWNLTTGDVRHDLELASPIRSLGFSPDGARLISTDRHGRLRLWDARRGVQEKTFRIGPLGMTVAPLPFSPEGRHFATGNSSSSIFIFRLARFSGKHSE